MSCKHYVHPRRFSKPKLIPLSSRWSALITVSIPGRSFSRKKSNHTTTDHSLRTTDHARCNQRWLSLNSLGAFQMKLTNDRYVILIGTTNFTERYCRDKVGWLNVSARDRMFRMTAEQVLNHVLPAVAGIKPNVTIKVERRDDRF